MLDDLLKEFSVLIQYVGNKRWRYRVGTNGNWYMSSTYGSARDAEKALEADIDEIEHTLHNPTPRGE